VASFRVWGGLNEAGGAQQLMNRAREVAADVCLAVDLPAIEAATLAPVLAGVTFAPLPSVDSLRVACDKWDMAQFLAARRFPHPRSVLCVDDANCRAQLRALDFPVLLKPRVGGNGAGIERFTDPDSLLAHLTTHPKRWGTTLAQRLVAGHDIDCSVLCVQGRVIAHTIQRGFTPTVGFRPPGGIEFTQHEGVLRVVRDLMRALNWNGVAHVDLRQSAETGAISIIEINPRFWGSVIGSRHAGINFPHLACVAGLGRTFEYPAFRRCRYVAGNTAVRFWSRGQLGTRIAGFTIADTVFRYALSDPLSSALEWFFG
jgi:phosphoribosylaminoimidazole carboxylase (NCAIR synthetase)